MKLATYFRNTYGERTRIAVIGENSYEWILTYFAVVCSNNIIVPIDKELASADIAELLKDCEATVFVYSKDYDDIRAVAKRIGKRTYVVYAYDGLFAGLEANRKVCGEIICGVFYVVAVDKNGHPTSMTDAQMMRYMMRFYEPEEYSCCDVLENWSNQLLKEFDDMVV